MQRNERCQRGKVAKGFETIRKTNALYIIGDDKILNELTAEGNNEPKIDLH